MVIINPADANEAIHATEAALLHNGPVYLRFGRYAVPNITKDIPDYKFELGKGVKYTEGNDVTIVATGLMVAFAMEAVESLRAEGINAEIINIHTIKPIDRDIIISSARKTGAVVTCEEHCIVGGLGSAVCEVLSESCPVPVIRVGVRDQYGRSGKVPELLEMYGLTPAHIADAAKRAISLKK
jgi:transketolase